MKSSYDLFLSQSYNTFIKAIGFGVMNGVYDKRFS